MPTCRARTPLGKIYSTNPLARRCKAVKRRTVDVGIFPNTTVLRLVQILLGEQDEDLG